MCLFRLLLYFIVFLSVNSINPIKQIKSIPLVKTLTTVPNVTIIKKLVPVRTENGEVIGQLIGSPSSTNLEKVWLYLGIPYAKPPVKERRFKDPDTNLNKKRRFALTEKSGCVMGIKKLVIGREDCLYLNIYSPVEPDPKTHMPVLVWIHGGGYLGGTGNAKRHLTYGLLGNDVILVAINYRLGIFGGFCTQDETAPGNYHIKDQIAALKWIKNNIENFGGDPDKITIWGQSAGAASVHFLIQAKQAEGLFHAAISESGSTLSPWALNSDPLRIVKVVAKNLKIDVENNTIEEIVETIRNVDYRKLQGVSAFNRIPFNFYSNGLDWAPCIENSANPNAVVTDQSYDNMKNGDYNRVPLLTGFTSNEFRLVFDPKFDIGFLSINNFTENITNFVPQDMNIDDLDIMKKVANKIIYFYFNGTNMDSNVTFVKFASDTYFVRSIYKTVELMSKNSPVYLYRYAFTGTARWRNYTIGGAGHGRELELLFNIPQKTDEAKLTQKRMLKLWTNFAKYANPTPENDVDRLIGLKWPQTTNEYLTYLNIDANLTIRANPEVEAMTFWNELYIEYGKPPFNKYKK